MKEDIQSRWLVKLSGHICMQQIIPVEAINHCVCISVDTVRAYIVV